MLTKFLEWLDAQFLKLDPKEQERRRMREMENRYLFVRLASDRRTPDKLCEDDACVERIREAEGS